MTYCPQSAQAICDVVAEGDVLKDIAKREDMPSLKVMRRWLIDRPEFAQGLREAERDRLGAWEDELLIRARDASKDRITKDGGFAPDPTAVARAKLACDTLARLLRAHHPTVWGDASRSKRPSPILARSFEPCRSASSSGCATTPEGRRARRRSPGNAGAETGARRAQPRAPDAPRAAAEPGEIPLSMKGLRVRVRARIKAAAPGGFGFGPLP